MNDQETAAQGCTIVFLMLALAFASGIAIGHGWQ